MAFIGHAVPAIFFIVFGALPLSHALYQACRLPPGSVLSEHLIDRRPSNLRIMGIFIGVFCIIGLCVEGFNGLFDISGDFGSNFFDQITHETMYLLFTLTAMVMVLESYRYLPPHSSRAATAFALLGECVLWTGHAKMQNAMNSTAHILLAELCFFNSVTFLYTAKYPSSVPVFVFALAQLFLQGTWLFALGHNDLDGHTMSIHKVGPFFCLHAMAVGFIVVIGTACAYRKTAGVEETTGEQKSDGQYERVAINSKFNDAYVINSNDEIL